jgi:hypothetical protein
LTTAETASKKEPGQWLPERLGLLLALLLVAAPALFWHGGTLDGEPIDFFMNYWSSRPLGERLLDSRGYDEFQSRELSYAVDFLDSEWVRLGLSLGKTWFIPPSAVAASLLLVAAWAWGAPRALPFLDPWTRWLLLALYLSNFAFLSTMGIVYRATKTLVAPLLLFELLFVLRESREGATRRLRAFGVVALTGLLMSLLDRQGFLEIATLAAILILASPFRPRIAHLALGAVTATLAAQAYNAWFGPWMIHRVAGYWPRMKFQRVRIEWLLDPRPWLQGLRLLADWVRAVVGSFPMGLFLAGAGLLVALSLWLEWRSEGRVPVLSITIVGIAASAQLVMTALMVTRHEPVTWIDHRLWYYPLPFQTALLFAIAWRLERWASARGKLPPLVPVVVLALVVSNIAHWPELAERMRSGPWFSAARPGSLALERSIASGLPDPVLADGYRRFFFTCMETFPAVAARAQPHVEEVEDVEEAVFREGRLFSWARHSSEIALVAPRAGRYRLEGAFELRSGDTLTIARSADPLHPLASVARLGPGDGREPLTLALDLPEGETRLRLASALPEWTLATEPRPRLAGFGLWLPFLLRPL